MVSGISSNVVKIRLIRLGSCRSAIELRPPGCLSSRFSRDRAIRQAAWRGIPPRPWLSPHFL